MKRLPVLPALIVCAAVGILAVAALRSEGRQTKPTTIISASDGRIRYTGRVDVSHPAAPRLYGAGASVSARFQGTECEALIGDENRWNKNRNYLAIVVDDGKPVRVQTGGKLSVIPVAKNLSPGAHTVTIYKDTEAAIGYIEVVGFRCAGLAALPPAPRRKLQFFGDSITSGAESDTSVVPCKQGEWYDRHNAYASYGMATGRLLNAQTHLQSRSGIGLMHSCCDMKQVMPDVWNTLDTETPTLKWDAKRYQPDAVMVCLGQNDGEQEPKAFDAAYVAFLQTLRTAYPKSQIVCLSSPMASASLRTYQEASLGRVVAARKNAGDNKVSSHVFSRSYNGGCGGHPDVAEHQKIAEELSGYLKTTMKW